MWWWHECKLIKIKDNILLLDYSGSGQSKRPSCPTLCAPFPGRGGLGLRSDYLHVYFEYMTWVWCVFVCPVSRMSLLVLADLVFMTRRWCSAPGRLSWRSSVAGQHPPLPYGPGHASYLHSGSTTETQTHIHQHLVYYYDYYCTTMFSWTTQASSMQSAFKTPMKIWFRMVRGGAETFYISALSFESFTQRIEIKAYSHSGRVTVEGHEVHSGIGVFW